MSDRRGNDRLVWIDCEMTGLDLSHDKLIEVAVVVTDADLTPVDPGLDLVLHADDEDLAAMVPVVQEMHAASGLTDEVRASTLDLAAAQQQVLDYVRRFVPEPRTAPLCGNSIATDRGFLSRDMPALDDHLHYRMIDVSSIKELARRWYPRIYFGQPPKGLAHRALADILESIQELAYYRRVLFVPEPGPTGDEVQAAAAAVTGSNDAASAPEELASTADDGTGAPTVDAIDAPVPDALPPATEPDEGRPVLPLD